MSINNLVFEQQNPNAAEETKAAIVPVLEEFGFSRIESKDAYILHDVLKKTVVIFGPSKVILNTHFHRNIKKNMVEEASLVMMDLNAKYGFCLGCDPSDGEVSYDHTLIFKSKPLTREAFTHILPDYLNRVNSCAQVIQKELRLFYPSLLDDTDDEDDGFVQRFQRLFRQRAQSEKEVHFDLEDLDLDDLDFDEDDD